MYIHCNCSGDLATHAVLVENWVRMGNNDSRRSRVP